MNALPKGWTTIALGDVSTINPKSAEKPNAGDPVSFVPMAELHADSARTSHGTTRPFHEVSKGYRLFQQNDLLVAKITPCFQNNKIGQARISHNRGVGSTEFHVVHPLRGSVDDRYLLHFLRQDWIRVEGERKMTGSGGQRRIPQKFLERLSLPLPPLDEQRRIAAILDQADNLIRAQDEVLTSLRKFRSASITSFITTFDTASVPLGTHLDFLTSGSRGWAKYYANSGPAFLRIQNVNHGTIHLDDLARVHPPDSVEARRTQVHPGDVLLSITADLGRTAVVPASLGPAHINQHLAILRSSTLAPEYLAAFLESPVGSRQLQKKNRGQTKSGLNFTDIRSVNVPVPPVWAQTRFASQLNLTAKHLTSQKRRLSSLLNLRSSLQSRAFRGEL